MPTKWLGIGCQQQLTAVSRGLAPIGHKTACSSTHSPVLLVGGWHHKSVPMAPQSESCGRTGGRKDVFDRPGRANASSSHIFTMSRRNGRTPFPHYFDQDDNSWEGKVPRDDLIHHRCRTSCFACCDVSKGASDRPSCQGRQNARRERKFLGSTSICCRGNRPANPNLYQRDGPEYFRFLYKCRLCGHLS